MTEITTVEAERTNLDLHVDLCAQRYTLLEKRLGILEVKMDNIGTAIAKGQSSLSTVIITSSATVVASLLGVIVTILMKF
jgi:hypothetical protein